MPVRAGDAYGNFPVDDRRGRDPLRLRERRAGRERQLRRQPSSRPPSRRRSTPPTCANTLFVFAAGNDGLNNDIDPTFPCSYPSARIICVGASTMTDGLAGYSNYGVNSVDLAAPGGEGGNGILSTYTIYTPMASLTDAFEDVGWNTRWVPYDPTDPTAAAGRAGAGRASTRLRRRGQPRRILRTRTAWPTRRRDSAASVKTIRNAAPFNFDDKFGCVVQYQVRFGLEEGITYDTSDWFRVRVGTSSRRSSRRSPTSGRATAAASARWSPTSPRSTTR